MSSTTTTTKRLACERCRDQKLRCDRGELTDGGLSKTCARCLRAGALCVSSNPRPLGRPPASASHASSDTTPVASSSRRSTASASNSVSGRRIRRSANAGHNASNRELTASPGSNFAWALRDPAFSGFPDLTTTALAGDAGAGASNGTRQPSVHRHMSTASGAGGAGHDQSWSPSASDALYFLGLPLGDNDLLLESLGNSSQMHLQSEDWPGPSEPSGRAVNTPVDAADSGLSKTSGTNKFNLLDNNSNPTFTNPLLELSLLSESIAHQIADIDSYPWGSAGTSICADNVHDSLEGNPVAKAIQSTSEFMSIIRQMNGSATSSPSAFGPTRGSAPSDSGISTSGSANGQDTFMSNPPTLANQLTLDAPVALVILSNYLVLLELFDRIIDRVLEALKKLLNISDFFQTGPDICIRGLPPLKGHLYIRILVQIIDDHIDRLEQLLGLPTQFRLSKRQNVSIGVFSGVEFFSLLHVVMTQLPMTQEGTGTDLIASLRDRLKSLQGILQGY